MNRRRFRQFFVGRTRLGRTFGLSGVSVQLSNVPVVPLAKKFTRTTHVPPQKSVKIIFPVDGETFYFFSLGISNGAIPSTAVLSQVQDGELKFHPSKKSEAGITLLQGRTGTKVSGECFPCIFVCSGQQTWEPSSTQLATTKLFSKCHYTDFTDG
jgi:hypothetical protein